MVNAKEATAILLKEYDTLRSELIARQVGTFQLTALLAVEAGICVGWFEKFGKGPALLWLIGSFFAVTGVLYIVYNLAIGNCAQRVREIESHINELSGVDLLCWETRFGAGRVGIRFMLGPDTTGNIVTGAGRWEALLSQSDQTDREKE